MVDENLMARWLKEQEKRLEASRAALAQLLSTRPEIVQLTVEYNGSGDQGQIEDVTAFDHNHNPLPVNDDARGAVEELLYDLLAVHCPGWEINEGSTGRIAIDAKTLEGTIEHNWVVTESHEIEFRTEPRAFSRAKLGAGHKSPGTSQNSGGTQDLENPADKYWVGCIPILCLEPESFMENYISILLVVLVFCLTTNAEAQQHQCNGKPRGYDLFGSMSPVPSINCDYTAAYCSAAKSAVSNCWTNTWNARKSQCSNLDPTATLGLGTVVMYNPDGTCY